jgi:hypothetical protein
VKATEYNLPSEKQINATDFPQRVFMTNLSKLKAI